MEKTDHELILTLSQSNPYLKKLYDKHIKLDKMVARFELYSRYSTSAAIKAKELKIEKLRGVDEMMKIISEARKNETDTIAMEYQEAV